MVVLSVVSFIFCKIMLVRKSSIYEYLLCVWYRVIIFFIYLFYVFLREFCEMGIFILFYRGVDWGLDYGRL